MAKKGSAPEAASIARPKAVPAAAPAMQPPFMAEVITSSRASTLPSDTTPRICTRDTAISAQAARTVTAASWRFSAVSVCRSRGVSASLKK